MFDEFQLGLYEGKMNEQERILKIMDDWTYDNFASWNDLIRRIKGEAK